MGRKHRLRASADFQHIRREGSTWLHPLLVMSVIPNQLDHSRFGFSVGRRLGTAVRRNLIKRRMREAVRLRVKKDQVSGSWDVLFIARHPMRDASYHQVDQAIGLLLRRAGLAGAAG